MLALAACRTPPPKGHAPADGVVDVDGDGSPAGEDCADGDADIHPGADEVCNGLDDDCDGVVDEDDARDAPTWYADADGDGAGDADRPVRACRAPAGAVADARDCDDADATVSPRAGESCNGVDDDCDGEVDEADATGTAVWYADADGDGFGDPAAPARACAAPRDHVASASDCDDTDPTRFPGATEVCGNRVAEDCAASPDQTFAACGLGGARSFAGADGTLDGDTTGEAVGRAVAGAGDLTGDGVPDLVIGASRSNRASAGAGAVFVVDGGFRGAADVVAARGGADVGAAAGDALGAAMVGVGDADGDGLADLLVGAPGAAAALLLAGPFTGDVAVDDVRFATLQADGGDGAGSALAAGDIDGDGLVDAILGAPDRGSGAALVFFGPLGDATPDAVLAATGAARAGEAVAAPGDLDGDGVGDLLIGGPADSAGAGTGGVAWFLSGPVSGTLDLDAVASARFVGVRTGAALGGAVRSLGDMNGDGHPDLGVSAYGDSRAATSAGAVHLFHGPTLGTVTSAAADATVTGAGRGDVLGLHLPGPADVDGDGTPDLVVGSAKSDLAAADAGALFLLLGPLTGTSSAADADGVVRGLSAGDGAGGSVAVLGDVDGDGTDDLIVGAGGASPAARAGAGAAYLLLGGGP